MLTGREIRDARTLLRWRRNGLASRTALSIAVIERAEAGDGEPSITLAQEIVIKHTFVTAGIDFAPDGPRLREGDV